ncbi:MAG: Cof-type HAD-IIB family hydrolase [Bacteroidales bacterium]
MQKYKILVLDLDGTLTNSKKEVSEENKKTLIEAQKNGVKIVLASGRPTYGIVPIAQELGIENYGGYILSFNGGTIINWETKETVYESVLPNHVVPGLYNEAKDHGFTILSYKDDHIITENKDDKYVGVEAHLNKMAVKEVPCFLNAVPRSLPKCLIVGNQEELAILEKKMQTKYGEEMSIYRSEPFFLELMPQNIDKAQSLQRLLDHLSLTKEEMIACGDGYNDLTMVEFAGLGVAMANAQDAVKNVSDYITLSNDEDGIAHVVRKFILENGHSSNA